MSDKKANSLDIEHATNMAHSMRDMNADIVAAIDQTNKANWGVVVLRFASKGRSMQIEVLDEPFESNVRIDPGE